MGGDLVPASRAKQLSPEEVQERIDRAFQLETQIKTAWTSIHGAWWTLAESLYEFHVAGAWSLLGYDKLEEWLAQPELGMSRSQFFGVVRLWRDLVVTRQIPAADLVELEPSKVREVAPAIMRGEVEVDEALSDARERGWRDLKQDAKYNPAKDGEKKSDSSKPLNAEDEPERVECPGCGSWVKKEQLEAHGGGE